MTSTVIDLNSPAHAIDPYPIYRQLLETEPAYQTSFTGPGGGMWLITRYDDVAASVSGHRSHASRFASPSPDCSSSCRTYG